MRSPITLSLPYSATRPGDAMPLRFFRTGRSAAPAATAAVSARIKSGVVPQQPPMISAPRCANTVISRPKSSAVISYAPVRGSGRPAFGLTMIGRSVHSISSSTIGTSSTGPSEQLTPSAATPRASSVTATDGTAAPRKVRPFCSNVIVTQIGSLVCSFAASTAALTS